MTDGAFDLLATKRAVFKSGLRSQEKLVALALLDHWSRAEESPFPSIERLAQWTSLARRTVLRALGGLEEAGVLVVTRRTGRSNQYELGHLASAPVSERHRCQSDTRARAAQPPVPQGHPTSVSVAPEVSKVRKQVKEPTLACTVPVLPSSPDPKPKRRRTLKPERPIPAEWTPTPTHRAFASLHGLQLELEAVAFMGHYDGQGVASPNGRFTTWLANQAKWSLDRNASRGGRHVQRGVAVHTNAETWGRALGEELTKSVPAVLVNGAANG